MKVLLTRRVDSTMNSDRSTDKYWKSKRKERRSSVEVDIDMSTSDQETS